MGVQEHLPQCLNQFGVVERLGKTCVSPGRDGIHWLETGPSPSDDYDWDLGPAFLDSGEEFKSGHSGQTDIRDNGMSVLLLEQREGLFSRIGRPGIESLQLQETG